VKRWTAADAAWLVVLAASLWIIVPWQGALDRIGNAAGVAPVPAARGYTRPALEILDAGAWWRVEPDYSLFLVRNVEFAGRRDWHLVSAYGPWAFLFRGYAPGNYVPLVVVWAAIALVAVLLLREFATIPIAIGFLVVIAADPRPGLLMVFPLLVLRAPKASTAVPGIILMALMALVKSSALAIGCIAVLAIARRIPWAPLLYAVSFVIFWFLAGQDAGWLLPFLRGTWHVSSAYGEAETSGAMTIPTALLLAAGLAAVAIAARRIHWIDTAALVLMVLAFMKTSLVRNDMFHASLAPMAMLSLLLVFASLWPQHISIPIVVASVLIIAPDLPPPVEFARQARAAADPAAARRRSDALFVRDMLAIRDRTPLPPIGGTIDVYGDRQSTAIAHSLRYDPRPVWQSYIAYDPFLARINADHLRGGDAPDAVLFAMSVTDERFPPLDDGFSWPELLSRYQPAAEMPEMALLRRRPRPLPVHFAPRAILHARLGEPIAIPAANELLWANIDIEPTLAGRALAAIYKVPELRLTVTTAGGERLGGRIIRSTAAAGFLLSPVVVGPHDFAAIAEGRAATLASRRVTSFIMTGPAFDRRDYTITLRALQ